MVFVRYFCVWGATNKFWVAAAPYIRACVVRSPSFSFLITPVYLALPFLPMLPFPLCPSYTSKVSGESFKLPQRSAEHSS